ncbi:flagellar protein FliT [Methylobacter sp.]|uniref:flagellar protein FliT n=1 Tax=Methylobacter sp. TaxID=2051955 RepID=UPI002FDCFE5B
MDIHTTADQLLNLTQAMLRAAELDDWDKFESQEQQRSAMLEMFFGEKTLTESTKLQLADIVKEIQLIDKTITNLIIQQRDQAAEELRHMKHAREGNKAYQTMADNSL